VRLENQVRIIADPASAEDIGPTITGLTEVGEAYVILTDSSETYVQAAGTLEGGFIVERRDGCAGEHYRVDRRVTGDELASMLRGYLQGARDWDLDLTWHRIVVGDRAPRA
jgi:hypothetical protein